MGVTVMKRRHRIFHFKSSRYFGPDTKRKIETYSKATNPAAPVEGNLHTLMRDSRSNVQRWKKARTADEIDRIRSLTRKKCDAYYSEDDW